MIITSIALVDISYLFRKNWHGTPRDAKPGEAAQQTLNQLAAVREQSAHVIICCDTWPYRRATIDPNYKAQREKPEPELIAQKKWLIERIEKDGYQIARAKGYEADDIIATLCKAYTECADIRIIGSDKDLAQCVSTNVRMFVPAVGTRPAEVRGPAEIREKYGVDPSSMGLWLAMTGDASDNIPGVRGIGPKKAAMLIREAGTLKGLAEKLAEVDKDDPKSALWKLLGENWESFAMSYKLTQLETDAPIDAQALLERKEPEKLVDDEVVDTDGEEVEEVGWGTAPPPKSPTDSSTPKEESESDGKSAQDFGSKSTGTTGRAKPQKKSEGPSSPAAMVTYGSTDDSLQPRDLKSAITIARWVYNGRLYPQFPTAESIFTIILRGKELGIQATTALSGMHMVNGKPVLSADLIRALAERDPNCEYLICVESDDQHAVWETRNRKWPQGKTDRYTYTRERAEKAGMFTGNNKHNWMTKTQEMLEKTAASKGCRRWYPGAVGGVYCIEEMGSDDTSEA